MDVKVRCPGCKQVTSAPEEYIGKQLKCGCGTAFIVPKPPTAPPQTPAAPSSTSAAPPPFRREPASAHSSTSHDLSPALVAASVSDQPILVTISAKRKSSFASHTNVFGWCVQRSLGIAYVIVALGIIFCLLRIPTIETESYHSFLWAPAAFVAALAAYYCACPITRCPPSSGPRISMRLKKSFINSGLGIVGSYVVNILLAVLLAAIARWFELQDVAFIVVLIAYTSLTFTIVTIGSAIAFICFTAIIAKTLLTRLYGYRGVLGIGMLGLIGGPSLLLAAYMAFVNPLVLHIWTASLNNAETPEEHGMQGAIRGIKTITHGGPDNFSARDNFVDAPHTDDPLFEPSLSPQGETRERTARGDECSQASQLFRLLDLDSVNEDVAIDADQEAKIKELPTDEDNVVESQKKLKEILRQEQFDRLRQIRLQASGVYALEETDVQDELALNDSQRESISDALRRRRQTLELFKSRPKSINSQLADKLVSEEKEMTARIVLNELTMKQKSKWKEMQGRKANIDDRELLQFQNIGK